MITLISIKFSIITFIILVIKITLLLIKNLWKLYLRHAVNVNAENWHAETEYKLDYIYVDILILQLTILYIAESIKKILEVRIA